MKAEALLAATFSLGTFKRIFFNPLPIASEYATSEELTQSLFTRFQQLLKMFPNIEKSTIDSFYCESDADTKFDTIISLFNDLLDAHMPISDENFFKLFIISLNHLTSVMTKSISETAIKCLFILSQVFTLSLAAQTHKIQCEQAIHNILSKALDNLLPMIRSGMNNDLASSATASMLQLLAALSAQPIGNEFIVKSFFRTLLSLMNDPTMKGIMDLESAMDAASISVKHVSISHVAGLKKFVMVHISSNAPVVSLRFICLYYTSRIVKAISLDKEEATNLLKMISQTFADTHSFANEIDFNKFVCCLKIIKRINQLHLIKGWDSFDSLPVIIKNYVACAISSNLIAANSEAASYQSTHDYLAEVFCTLEKLLKEANEFKDNISSMIEKTLQGIISEVGIINTKELELYIAEFLYDNRSSIGLIIELIKIETMKFTFSENSEIEIKINKFVIKTVNSQIEGSDGELFIKLIEQVKIHSADEQAVFGICKLLYSAIKAEVYTNYSFSLQIRKVKRLDYKEYLQNENQRIPVCFLLIDGIIRLTQLYLLSGKEILGGLCIELTKNPLIAEQLLKDSDTITKMLNFQLNPQIASLLENLVSFAKYNHNKHDETFSLPAQLVTHLKDAKNINEESLVFYINLMTSLVSYEEGVTSTCFYQAKLNEIMAFTIIFKPVLETKATINILCVYLRFLKELMRCNSVVSSSVLHSSIVEGNSLYSHINKSVQQVTLVIKLELP